MKKINQFLFLFLVAAASLLTSCSTDIEPIDPAVLIPDPMANGQLKVDIDGQTFVATNVQASVSATAISITGLRSGNNDFIQITLPAPLNQVGTYTWADATSNSVLLGLIYSNSASEGFISAPSTGDFADYPEYTDTAKVTVTSIDMQNKTISGTFQFTGGRFNAEGALLKKEFTNGSFTNLSFAGGTTTPTNDTFFAKIDGTAFNPTTITGNILNGSLFVIGKKAGVENIAITIPASIVAGTYAFSTFGEYRVMYIADATQNGTFNGDSGTLTIISNNTSTNKIKGTFNFLGESLFSTDTHTITEGAFEVSYQ